MRLSKHTCLDRRLCKIQSYFWAQFTRITLEQNKNLVVWSLLFSILTHQPHTSNSITIYTLYKYISWCISTSRRVSVRLDTSMIDVTQQNDLGCFFFCASRWNLGFLSAHKKQCLRSAKCQLFSVLSGLIFWDAEKALSDPNWIGVDISSD